MLRKFQVLLTIVGIFCILLSAPGVILAASSPFSQTDWSGGSGQTSFSDATKYDSGSNVVTSTPGQVTLSSTSSWYNSSWGYRKKITFDNSAQSSPLVNFPVLIKLTTSNTDYSKIKAAGADIRFTDSDGTTLLKYEIEKWDVTGDSFVWVKVPQIDASSGTDNIYFYYGNSAAGDAQDANNVWKSGTQLVQHLEESGSCPTSFTDSTSNGNTGSCGDSPTYNLSGEIDGSRTFDGSNDYIDLGNNSALQLSGELTLSAWIKLNSDYTSTQTILSNTDNSGAFGNYLFEFGRTDNKLTIVQDNSVDATSTGSISDNNWHHVVVTRSGSIGNWTIKFYIDGALDSTTPTVNNPGLSPGNASIGRPGSFNGNYFKGSIDETRAYNSGLTSDWIAAEYKSQSNSFNTLGSQEQYYASAGTLTSSIFDTEGSATWGDLTFSATTPTNTTATVKIRTSNASDMTGATAFSGCTAISSGVDISSNGCVADGQRYVQYQIGLTTTDPVATPTFNDVSIAFTTASPSPAPSSSSSSSGPSTPSAPSCNNSSPPGAPGISKFLTSETSADIFFTPVSGTVTEYVISYGFDNTASNFSGSFGAPPDPLIKQTIKNLPSGTTFYVKVRAGNGCATGLWSGIVKLTTTGSANNLSKVIQVSQPQASPVPPAMPKPAVQITQAVVMPSATPGPGPEQKGLTAPDLPVFKMPDLSFFIPEINLGPLNALCNTFTEFGASAKSSLASIYDQVFNPEPLMISDVKVASMGRDYAVITWTTNIPASSKVNYGDSYDYGRDLQSQEKVMDHKVVVVGLEYGKTYYYEVMSQSNSGYSFDARHEFKLE